MNQQQQNQHLILEGTVVEATCGASITYTGKIFALDSAVVKTQSLFGSCGGFLFYLMYHHKETTKSNAYCDKTKKRALNSQPVRAKFVELPSNGEVKNLLFPIGCHKADLFVIVTRTSDIPYKVPA